MEQMNLPASATKWHNYYHPSSHLPWDTRRPASQLVYLLAGANSIVWNIRSCIQKTCSADNLKDSRIIIAALVPVCPLLETNLGRSFLHKAELLPTKHYSPPTPAGCPAHLRSQPQNDPVLITPHSWTVPPTTLSGPPHWSHTLHSCPACEDMKPCGPTPAALELACGTGASCVYISSVLRSRGARSRDVCLCDCTSSHEFRTPAHPC